MARKVEQGRLIFAERIPIGERIRDVIEDPSGRLILWTEASVDPQPKHNSSYRTGGGRQRQRDRGPK